MIRSKYSNPYLFTGRRLDSETGLYYYRARMYSPYIGRFLQTDPIGYAGGLNLYTYCGNNPVIFFDPYGLCKDTPGYDYWSAFGGIGSGYIQDVKNHFVGIATAPVDYYRSFRGAGMGRASSGLQAANMTVGRIVGYSTLAEGIEGVDVRTTTELQWGGWGGRGARIGFGTAQTLTFAMGAAEVYHIKATGGSATWRGGEVVVKNAAEKTRYRISPLGHRANPGQANPWYRRLPQYHRRVVDPSTGQTLPGQGIGRHRPWQGSF